MTVGTRGDELETLREVARSLSSGASSHEVLQTLCTIAEAQGRASGASVAQVCVDSGQFIATSGIAQKLLYVRFELPGTATERAVEQRRPVALAGPDDSSSFFGELLPKLGTGPVLVLPLFAQQELMGVLAAFRRTDEPAFDQDDVARLVTLADMAALALWKARLIEDAQAADAAKTALLATLSHELRTPLAALEGYGELLEDEILGPLTREQKDVIVRLRTVSRHLGTLIEDILTFASLEAQRVSVRLSEVNIDELLDSLHPFLEPLAREKGIDFSIRAEAGLPAIHSDEGRLRQVLLNLCQNAIKFTDDGTVRLTVARSVTGDGYRELHFAVSDTGVGITPEDFERLFRPFSQLADVPTRRHAGTGLGLYISRRLADMLDGRIDVSSTRGQGSTFTLILRLD